MIGQTVWRSVIVMERRLDDPLPEVTPRLPVQMQLLTVDTLGLYARFRPDQDRSVIRNRLEQGHRCFAVWYQGRIVHAGWAAVRHAWIEYLGVEFPLEAGDVYQFDSYTAPAFRGLDLAAARIVWMARFTREAGFRRLLAVVWPKNTRAFRPLEKAGYQRCGRMSALRVGSWRRVFCSGLS